MRAAGLKLASKKCNLFKTEVTVLGHVVSCKEILKDPRKTQVMTNWPVHANVKELRIFVGLCSYYRKFIRDFATIAKPLHRLTEKNSQFIGQLSVMLPFSRLKQLLVDSFVLAYSNPNGSFFLDTDASGVGIGIVLSQEHNGVEKVIGYFS